MIPNIKNTLLSTALFMSTAMSMDVMAQETPFDGMDKNPKAINYDIFEKQEFDEFADEFATDLAEFIMTDDFKNCEEADQKVILITNHINKYSDRTKDKRIFFFVSNDEDFKTFSVTGVKFMHDLRKQSKDKAKKPHIKNFDINSEGKIIEYKSKFISKGVMRMYVAPPVIKI